MGEHKRNEEAIKKANKENPLAEFLDAIELSHLEIGTAGCRISAALGNLRHRLGSEIAIWKSVLRRNAELEVELDKLRAEVKQLRGVE
jgi:hypothetical protein